MIYISAFEVAMFLIFGGMAFILAIRILDRH